jgi:hypothetical protein
MKERGHHRPLLLVPSNTNADTTLTAQSGNN